MSLVSKQWEAVEFQPEYDDSAQWSAVLNTSQLSPRQKSLIKQLVEFSKLPLDWDSYGSPPLSAVAVELAQDVIYCLDLDFFPLPNIAPISGGGVQFEWHIASRSVELDIGDVGVVSYLKTENNNPLEEGVIDEALPSRLRSLIMWTVSGTPVEEAA